MYICPYIDLISPIEPKQKSFNPIPISSPKKTKLQKSFNPIPISSPKKTKLQMAANNKTVDISINIVDTVISNDIKYVKIGQVLAKFWAIQFYTLIPSPVPAATPWHNPLLPKRSPYDMLLCL